MTDEPSHIHVIPVVDFTEHEESSSCWCQPVMIERSPNTGVEIWAHNRAMDKPQ